MPLKMALLLIGTGLAAALCTGCQEDPIRQFDAPKPDERLLAAMLPHGDRVWFFKLRGPAKQIAEQQAAFLTFLDSVRFPDGAREPIGWDLPEGWESIPTATDNRYATIRLGSKDAPLELTVVPLEKEKYTLKANVNRWRGQIGLQAISPRDMARFCRQIELKAGKATLVDMTSRTPFLESESGAFAESTFEYDSLPDGWHVSKPDKFSRYAFQVSDGGRTADITVTPLPNEAGGLVENVNRWRRQVSLPELADDQVEDLAHKIEVDGDPGRIVDMTGTEQAGAPSRIIGVIVLRPGRTWFFKMKGPPDWVEKQKAAFTSFLQTVRFEERLGDNDG
jgi:hypothetical protein